jgi:hypothetical protein
VSALVAVTAPASATPTGSTPMTTAKVKASEISVKYPRSWLLVPLTKKDLAAQEKILSKKNPKVAAAMAATDVSQYRLRAIDPTGSSQNVGVQFVQGQGSPSSLADFKSGIVPGFKAAGGTVLDTAAVKLSGKAADRIDLTLPVKLPDASVVVARIGALVLPQGNNTTSVSVTASNNESGVALINSILSSVRHV